MVYVRLLTVPPIALGAWSMALVLWQPPEYYYSHLTSFYFFPPQPTYSLQMLCERVGRIYREAMGYIREEDRSKSQREGGGGEEGETVAGGNVAINLGIKKSREKNVLWFATFLTFFSADIQIDEYFPTFLNMAKNLMEGSKKFRSNLFFYVWGLQSIGFLYLDK